MTRPAKTPILPAESRSKLTLVPCDLDEANAFVKHHHRHHGKCVGHKFSLAACDEDREIRGVAIVGRPVNRTLDNGWTLEVNRVATDGCPNACSFLYGAAWKATKALGYRRLITYTLAIEGGDSLRGSGWIKVGEAGGGSWDRRSRPRVDKHPTMTKIRWEKLEPGIDIITPVSLEWMKYRDAIIESGQMFGGETIAHE